MTYLCHAPLVLASLRGASWCGFLVGKPFRGALDVVENCLLEVDVALKGGDRRARGVGRGGEFLHLLRIGVGDGDGVEPGNKVAGGGVDWEPLLGGDGG